MHAWHASEFQQRKAAVDSVTLAYEVGLGIYKNVESGEECDLATAQVLYHDLGSQPQLEKDALGAVVIHCCRNKKMKLLAIWFYGNRASEDRLAHLSSAGGGHRDPQRLVAGSDRWQGCVEKESQWGRGGLGGGMGGGEVDWGRPSRSSSSRRVWRQIYEYRCVWGVPLGKLQPEPSAVCESWVEDVVKWRYSFDDVSWNKYYIRN